MINQANELKIQPQFGPIFLSFLPGGLRPRNSRTRSPAVGCEHRKGEIRISVYRFLPCVRLNWSQGNRPAESVKGLRVCTRSVCIRRIHRRTTTYAVPKEAVQ